MRAHKREEGAEAFKRKRVSERKESEKEHLQKNNDR